jgi:hypothetical protein
VTAGETALLHAGLAASPSLQTDYADGGGFCLRHLRPPPASAVGGLARRVALARADLLAAETDPPPPAAGDGGAAVHLHGPTQLFANVIPYPPRTSTVTDLATTSRP